MTVKGIDISYHNGDIDFRKVKAQGIKFVIIRASCSRHEDVKLAEYVAGCEANNIPYGFYHAMYATTRGRAEYEANLFLEAIAPYRPTYPVYVDLEYWRDKNGNVVNNISGELFTELGLLFASKVEKAGYYTGFYASKSFIENTIDYSQLKRFDVWVAQWGNNPTLSGAFGLWQNSSTGRVNGISTNVDTNVSYKDYPSIIRRLGLNKIAQPITKYSVKAIKQGLTKTEVDSLLLALKPYNMTVEVKKC